VLLDLRHSNGDAIGTLLFMGHIGKFEKAIQIHIEYIIKRISQESHKSAKEIYGNKFGHEFAQLL
jgi:hypothetical protein